MNIKYNLHDSLIESFRFDPFSKTAFLEIDLCNWMQDGYEENEPESKTITIVFYDVSYINPINSEYVFDSNEILCITSIDENTIKISFKNESGVGVLVICAKRVGYQND